MSADYSTISGDVPNEGPHSDDAPHGGNSPELVPQGVDNSEVVALRDRVNGVTCALATAHDEAAALRIQVHRLQELVAQREAEAAALQFQLKEQSEDIAKHQAASASLLSHMNQQAEAVAKAEAERAALRFENKELRAEAAELREFVMQREAEAAALSRQLEDQRLAIEQRDADDAAIHRLMEDQAKTIANREARVAEEQRLADERHNALANRESHLDDRERDVAARAAEVAKRMAEMAAREKLFDQRFVSVALREREVQLLLARHRDPMAGPTEATVDRPPCVVHIVIETSNMIKSYSGAAGSAPRLAVVAQAFQSVQQQLASLQAQWNLVVYNGVAEAVRPPGEGPMRFASEPPQAVLTKYLAATQVSVTNPMFYQGRYLEALRAVVRAIEQGDANPETEHHVLWIAMRGPTDVTQTTNVEDVNSWLLTPVRETVGRVARRLGKFQLVVMSKEGYAHARTFSEEFGSFEVPVAPTVAELTAVLGAFASTVQGPNV